MARSPGDGGDGGVVNGVYRMLLTNSRGNEATIVRLRQEICRAIGLDPHGPASLPLDYATYLFAYSEGDPEPLAMVEFFFYDQAYQSFSESVYSQAANLAAIAPMDRMAHLRSIILLDHRRGTLLFLYTVAAMVSSVALMGGSTITAGTGANNQAILALHHRAGMKPLGRYSVDGSPQQLSLLEIDPIAQRASLILQRRGVQVDFSAAPALRLRHA